MLKCLLVNLGLTEYSGAEQIENYRNAYRIVKLLSGNYALEGSGECGWSLNSERFNSYSDAENYLNTKVNQLLDNTKN